MKNKSDARKILLIILLLAGVCLFSIITAGAKEGYFKNYAYNFKKNVLALSEYYGIELNEPVREALAKIPYRAEDMLYIDSIINSTDDIPNVQYEDMEASSSDARSNPVALASADTYKYADYGGSMLCVNDTSVVAYDSSGSPLWAIGIHMSDPILDVSGDYYMIAERGGKKVALFEKTKRIYAAEADGNIKSASLSEKGDVVIVSDKEHYKGAVIVINKNGDRVFSWSSGRYNITDADIAANSRKVAVSLLSTETDANSIVKLFNISNGVQEGETTFNGSVVFDVDFLGEVLNVFSDNKIVGLSQKMKVLWEADYSSRKLLSYRAEDSGYKITTTDNNNLIELEVLTGRGTQEAVFASSKKPGSIDIRSGRVAYNIDRDLIFSGLSGANFRRYSCSRDIKGIHIIDNSSLVVVYSTGLEFINF